MKERFTDYWQNEPMVVACNRCGAGLDLYLSASNGRWVENEIAAWKTKHLKECGEQ